MPELVVTTTITSRVDIATMTPSHEVHVESVEEGITEDFAYAVAYGGCRAAMASMAKEVEALGSLHDQQDHTEEKDDGSDGG